MKTVYFVFVVALIAPLTVLVAQVPVATPIPVPDIPVADFLSQVLDAIKGFGGIAWIGKIAIIITLLISSMKVSILRLWIWDKVKGAQVWVAPLLGLALGLIQLKIDGHLSLPGILAYVSAGAGAIILHELLDSAKNIPGLGSGIVGVINLLMSYLGAVQKDEPVKPA